MHMVASYEKVEGPKVLLRYEDIFQRQLLTKKLQTVLEAHGYFPNRNAGWMIPLSLPLSKREMNETNNTDKWKVEGRKILSNASTCKIKFIGRPDSLGDIDSLLAQAITARLAADAAYTLVQSNNVTQLMWQLYSQKLAEAQSIDQIESSRDHFISTRLEDARSGLGSDTTRFGKAWW